MTIFVLPFEKMHGLGNDFIIVERRHLPNNVDEVALVRQVCNRNFGIGADGLIIVDHSNVKQADFAWSYYNRDGSEAEMCGNGMRCFAKYVYERGFTEELSFSVLTKAGIIKPQIEPDGTVTLNLGMPVLPNELKNELKQELVVNSEKIIFSYIKIGNPHCVIFTEDEINEEKFYKLGPLIEVHNDFPGGINVEFVKILNKNTIKCRVWERGCGPTLACGTGASAALVAANINNLTDSEAIVILPGGSLKIKWDKASNIVYLNGPVTFVYTGQYNLDPKLVSKSLLGKSHE